MLRNISIGFAFIALIICLILFAEHHAFEQGWNLASDFWNNTTPDSPSFSIGTGPSTYGFLIERYLITGFLLVIYVVGELIKKELLSKIICLSSLILIIYQLWGIYNWYLLLIETFPHYSVDPYFRLINTSTPFVWVVFLIVIVLLIMQIVKLFTTTTKPFPKLPSVVIL